ncbi:MAG: membrane protein of unknown function [Promethearchaeota archaeon]|nr:MAG: membrane protein of unknown function [Candidatus Lokiarchaeota archaeon]
MACDECLGLIVISAVSFIIGFILINRFLDQKNKFTLYMASFFITAAIGWLVWFLSTEWVFDVFESMVTLLVLIGLIPQLILLFFILAFLDVSIYLRILLIGLATIFSIIHLFVPELRILTIVSTIIISLNIILFIINWRRNDDIKSLGFAIGLMLILVGEALISVSHLIHGIFLILAAVDWAITYSGVLEKFS